MRRKIRWLLAGLVLVPLVGGLALYLLAKQHAAKIEPYIRDQAVAYLRDRFHADVEMERLQIDIPALSPMKLYLSKGNGVMVSVTGQGIVMSQGTQRPLRIQTLRFEVDLGQVFAPHKGVTVIYMDGVEISVPPKGEKPAKAPGDEGARKPAPDVTIGEIVLTNAKLMIRSKDPNRQPLQFNLHRIRLQHAGVNVPMRYQAELRIPKPEGEVTATGNFGPWNRDEAGDTPLDGDYIFDKANLGVFSAIGGILHSTGHFSGKLNEIAASGEATVPDFFLKASGNRLALYAKFEALVDGTNGNTILKPVHGRLGKTSFVTSGGVVKHDGDTKKTIELDVNMPAGRLEDVLLLAMKGKEPFMTGTLQMTSRILVPPLSGKVIDKLRLNGQFQIKEAKFLRAKVQDKIDTMSRQAQGQPENQAIDEVVSDMSGKFRLENGAVHLADLAFAIPGANLRLQGSYDLGTEVMDFHGDLKLRARLSETQTGWKRWVLKPVDPFFTKKGAGLYSKVQITGTRQDPKFGREK